tara:strand:- start:571 stop:1599 length:1029 start_codon:yes stop_codon:yes gene_type:complete
MRFLILFLFASISANATSPDLSGVRSPTSTDLNLESADDYTVDGTAYQGRNINRANSMSYDSVQTTSGISKSVSTNITSQQAQMDNLESTAGEFVQKLEEDRQKKSKEHEKIYNDSKTSYTNAYNKTKLINVDNLGNEQDPYIQNAFKCKDLNNCSRGDNDPHAVPTCNSSQVLHWTGEKWQCLSQFKNPDAANCTSDQWAKPVNNGIACIDYIYLWAETGMGACQSTGEADIIYSCMRKRTPTDEGSVVSSSNCKAEKPEGSKSCVASWSVGSWSSCKEDKVCTTKNNGSDNSNGTTCKSYGYKQKRSVSCPSGYICNDPKPATEQSCSPPDRWCGKACEG